MHPADRSQTAAAAADFVVSGGGSVSLVHPLTDDAKSHLMRVVDGGAQFFGNAVGVAHRYIRGFVNALSEDGFTVAGED